jgi:hypothetical protein
MTVTSRDVGWGLGNVFAKLRVVQSHWRKESLTRKRGQAVSLSARINCSQISKQPYYFNVILSTHVLTGSGKVW